MRAEMMLTTAALLVAAPLLLTKLVRRLQLSLAKHRSLAGHSLMAKRIARLVPGYSYDANRFFAADDAPADVQAQRKAGFARLSAALKAAAPQTLALTGLDEVSFHMSGTEAVMQAVRLARYHTGRRHLVRFCGAYHGWWEDVQPGHRQPAAAARDLHPEGHGRATACRCCDTPQGHRLRAGQSAAGPAPEPRGAGRLLAGRQRPPRKLRPRGLHRGGCRSCARCARGAASC
jgi:hypothetical protein